MCPVFVYIYAFLRVLQICLCWLGLVGERPYIYLLLSEVRITLTTPIFPCFSFLKQLKKNITRRKRMAVLGWRGGQTAADSQIGQLLYYMLGVQLQRLQLFLSPSQRAVNYTPPSPLLGIFIEEGKVHYIYIYKSDKALQISYSLQIAPVVSMVTHSSPGSLGEWVIQMKTGRQERLCGKSLRGTMGIVHQALSQQIEM